MFDCSRVLEYAKIRTVLQSMLDDVLGGKESFLDVTATSSQHPLFPVPKMAVVEKFNCSFFKEEVTGSYPSVVCIYHNVVMKIAYEV